MTSTAEPKRARRTAWLIPVAAALVMAYLLLRRRAAADALVEADPVVPAAPAPGPEPESVALPAAERGREQPLPTWVRASIVVVALLAFFAVSLIAKQV